MFFTQEDYRKIQDWLSRNSSKDSELLEATPLNGNEIISIVQANHNKKISIKDFVNQIFKVGSPDFFNVTDKLEAPYITLEEAISMLPTKAKKQGQVITFLNKEGNWDVYQFIGANNQCNIPDKWNNIFDIDKYIIDSLLPDEEDLTKTKPDAKGNSYVSLKDRAYNPSQFSGYGEKILRRHIIEVEVPGLGMVEKNILYQDVFDSPNTIYKVRYDFDLNGQTIELPENCILDFVGGSIDNGTLVLNDTLVYPFGCVEKEVIKCETEGAYKAGQMFFDREQGYFLIWDGENWKTKVAYRVIDNKLNESLDGGVTWTPVSDYIAAYFRWSPHNTIQISRNNRDWDDLSEPLADNVYIKGYYNSVSQLPSDALIGDIYMVGTGAPYDMYINTSEGWKNNGPFTSITAGIEQTTGQSTTNVMSQKAVTDKLTELESDTNTKLTELSSLLLLLNRSILTPSVEEGKFIRDTGVILEGASDVRLTETIALSQGEVITFYGNTINDIVSAITLCQSDGTPIKMVVRGLPSRQVGNFTYLAEEDCYVRLSYTEGAVICKVEKSIFSQINEIIHEKESATNTKFDEVYGVIEVNKTDAEEKATMLESLSLLLNNVVINPNSELNKFISKNGVITSGDANLHLTEPIALLKGEVITFYGSTLNDFVSAVTLCKNDGTPIKMVVQGLPDRRVGNFTYLAEEDCYVRLSYIDEAIIRKVSKSIFSQISDILTLLYSKTEKISENSNKITEINKQIYGNILLPQTIKFIGNGGVQQNVQIAQYDEIKEREFTLIVGDMVFPTEATSLPRIVLRSYASDNTRLQNELFNANTETNITIADEAVRFELLFFATITGNSVIGYEYMCDVEVKYTGFISIKDTLLLLNDSVIDLSHINIGVDGDSITAGTKKWSKYMADILGCKQYNVAVGSACWSYKEKLNIEGTGLIVPQHYEDADFAGYGGQEDLSTNTNIQKFINNNACTHIEKFISLVNDGTYPIPDAFIFAMGTNADTGDGNREGSVDEAMNAQSINDTDFVDSSGKSLKYSMCGAMRWCIETIKRTFPDCKVFVSLPIQRAKYERNRNYLYPKVQLIKEMAIQMGCQIIDQYKGSGITAAIEADSSPFGPYLYDGLHPNDAGYRLMGAFAASQIKSKYYANIAD